MGAIIIIGFNRANFQKGFEETQSLFPLSHTLFFRLFIFCTFSSIFSRQVRTSLLAAVSSFTYELIKTLQIPNIATNIARFQTATTAWKVITLNQPTNQLVRITKIQLEIDEALWTLKSCNRALPKPVFLVHVQFFIIFLWLRALIHISSRNWWRFYALPCWQSARRMPKLQNNLFSNWMFYYSCPDERLPHRTD